MKNYQNIAIICLTLALFAIGCSSINPFAEKKTNQANSNKSFTDKAVDTAVGEEKTGIPECDEVLDMIAAETNNPDDNFAIKALKATFLNKIKAAVKDSIEKNKADKTAIAKNCKDYKVQLDKYKAEEDQKKK